MTRITRRSRVRDRDMKAWTLRAQGLSLEEVARELGIPKGTAWDSIERGRKEFARPANDEYVSLNLRELDIMAAKIWEVLENRHYLVTPGGKLVPHPVTGDPLHDFAPVFEAVRTLLSIQQRRAKLLGLDQPVKAQVTYTSGDIDAAVNELAAEMRALAGPASAGTITETAPEEVPVSEPA